MQKHTLSVNYLLLPLHQIYCDISNCTCSNVIVFKIFWVVLVTICCELCKD